MGAALTLALATLVAMHVSLVVGLARQRAWGKALAAVVMPPLAPWWGWDGGMRGRSVAWLAAIVAYAAGVAIV